MDVARATSSPTRSSILRSTPGIGDCTQSDVPAWTEARLVKSALIRMIGCACLLTRGVERRGLHGESALLLGTDVVAPPPHGNPFWMLVDPLRDVGLGIHNALIARQVCRQRKMMIFALTERRQCADGHDQFDQAHPQLSVSDTLEIRSIAPPKFHPLDIIFQPFQAPPGLRQTAATGEPEAEAATTR